MVIRVYPVGVDQNSVLANIDANFSTMKNILEQMNFKIEKIENYTDKELEKIKLLIIPGKVNYKLTAREVRLILDSVLRGLNLLILLSSRGDCRLNNNLQEILEPLGIYIRCDEIQDMNGNPELKLEVSEKHPLLEDVYDIYYVEGCSFMVKKRVTTEIVLYSKGSQVGEVPIIVAARYGNGRIIVVGSYKMFDNTYIRNYSNARLFVNMLLWLTRRKLSTATIETILSSAGVKAAVEIPVVSPEELKGVPERHVEKVEKKPELISKEEIEMLKREIFESVSEMGVVEPVTSSMQVPVEEVKKEGKIEHIPFPHTEEVSMEVPHREEIIEEAKLVRPSLREEIPREFVEQPLQPISKPTIPPLTREEIMSGKEAEELKELVRDIVELRGLLDEFIQDLLALNNKLIKGVSKLNEKLEKIEEKLRRLTH